MDLTPATPVGGACGAETVAAGGAAVCPAGGAGLGGAAPGVDPELPTVAVGKALGEGPGLLGKTARPI